MSVSKKYIRGGFAILIGLLGVFIILWAWQLPPFKHSVETTDNAYVRGQVTVMSPQVSGYITKVNVTDYEQVKKAICFLRSIAAAISKSWIRRLPRWTARRRHLPIRSRASVPPRQR